MEGWGSFSPVKQSWRGSCCSLKGKVFLGCVSYQSQSCRPKSFFSSVRCCYHLQSHIKTVFVLCFDFPHTENSNSTGLFEREKESECFRCSVCVCLPIFVSWIASDYSSPAKGKVSAGCSGLSSSSLFGTQSHICLDKENCDKAQIQSA